MVKGSWLPSGWGGHSGQRLGSAADHGGHACARPLEWGSRSWQRPGQVGARGVLVPSGPWGPRKLTNPAGGTTVPWGTHAGPSFRVALLSETTLARLGAVGTEHPWRAAWERAREAGECQRLAGHCSLLLGWGLTWGRAWSSSSFCWYLPSRGVRSSLGGKNSFHPGGGRSHHGDTGRAGRSWLPSVQEGTLQEKRYLSGIPAQPFLPPPHSQPPASLKSSPQLWSLGLPRDTKALNSIYTGRSQMLTCTPARPAAPSGSALGWLIAIQNNTGLSQTAPHCLHLGCFL